MEISATKIVKVNITTLKIHMKCRDTFECSLVDQDGEEVVAYEGYVPSFMPGDHYGDCLILDIDIDTGSIKNWIPPTAKVVEKFVKGRQEE